MDVAADTRILALIRRQCGCLVTKQHGAVVELIAGPGHGRKAQCFDRAAVEINIACTQNRDIQRVKRGAGADGAGESRIAVR